LEVREHPRVIFRVSENTWLEAIVRYLVAPREAGRVKTRLIKKLLTALNAAPDRVMFRKVRLVELFNLSGGERQCRDARPNLQIRFISEEVKIC